MAEPSWYTAQSNDREPHGLPVYQSAFPSAPKRAGIGLRIPPRQADCTGVRPSWYPFQINVCDVDASDEPPLTWRHLTTDPPPS